ncbi:MAG TPA: hypothetical protein VIJ32_14125, partial [Actinomycetes bacterium]
QELDLGRRFDAVLLASFLVNTDDRDLRRPGPGLLAATVEYQVGDRVWTQWFTAERLDDQALAAALGEAGLLVDAYLTGDGSWVRAVPASLGAALGRSPR